MIKRFDYKLAGMRKPDSFIVYPRKAGEIIMVVQGNRTIAEFDPRDGKGMLNWKGSNSKYFLHLNRILGAEPFDFPEEFVRLALECEPHAGDTIAGVVQIA